MNTNERIEAQTAVETAYTTWSNLNARCAQPFANQIEADATVKAMQRAGRTLRSANRRLTALVEA